MPASIPRARGAGVSRVGFAYIAPAVLLYSLFVLAPFAHSIFLSFYSWDGIGPRRFVGLQNFRAVFASGLVLQSFAHSFVLILFYSGLSLAIALFIAAVINRSRVKGLSIYRTVLFLPYVIAPTAVAVIWRWILAPDGLFNIILHTIGLGRLARPWLGDFTFALPAVGLVGTWVMSGLCLVLLVAGVQNIPRDLYEASSIDGAGAMRQFTSVTLPGLRNEIAVVLVLTVVAALKTFDTVYVMTQGGPGTSTQVPSWLVYNEAFIVGSVGGAAAVGVVLAIVIAALSFATIRIL